MDIFKKPLIHILYLSNYLLKPLHLLLILLHWDPSSLVLDKLCYGIVKEAVHLLLDDNFDHWILLLLELLLQLVHVEFDLFVSGLELFLLLLIEFKCFPCFDHQWVVYTNVLDIWSNKFITLVNIWRFLIGSLSSLWSCL